MTKYTGLVVSYVFQDKIPMIDHQLYFLFLLKIYLYKRNKAS
jgi:hypothetical protein